MLGLRNRKMDDILVNDNFNGRKAAFILQILKLKDIAP